MVAGNAGPFKAGLPSLREDAPHSKRYSEAG
jgi:hypothetical protein